MTFDFAPDWMTTMMNGVAFTRAEPPGSAAARGLPMPSYPDDAQVAALVSELFAEGTLSPEQLFSLAGLPEMKPHLTHALAALPSPGKKQA